MPETSEAALHETRSLSRAELNPGAELEARRENDEFEPHFLSLLAEREEIFDRQNLPALDRVAARTRSTFKLMEARKEGLLPNGLAMRLMVSTLLNGLERKQ